MTKTKDRVVSARVTEEEYKQLMMIAKAHTLPSEAVKISVVVREAVRQYLERCWAV